MRLLWHVPYLAALASAQLLIDSSSFGHGDKISPNGYSIPGWHVSGAGQTPELLSDKVVLTPGYRGNSRGALWAEARIPEHQWIAQFDFRATGPEKGSGNLQIWYVSEGQWAIGSSSVYTVGKFDGLAVVIDPSGNQGGQIRGFMNDGSLDYKSYHSVDSLAFGHCDYSYRNLGRTSKLQIKNNDHTFEVVIDDKLCFSTDKVRLPKDYQFGITAASAENPDSFEAYKFLLFTDPSVPQGQPFQHQGSGQQANTPQDSPASQYTSSQSQFEDLHNRIQALSGTLGHLVGEVGQLADHSAGRHQEVIRNVQSGQPIDRINALDQKLSNIENSLRGFETKFQNLQNSLRDSHSSLAESLPKHMSDVITTNGPRMGLIIFVFVVVQVVLVGAYQVYKRRSKQGPKKYL